jgi:hypothetical protein
VASDYRIASALLVRVVGAAFAVGGLLVLLLVLVGGALDWPVTALLLVVVVAWLTAAGLTVVLPRVAPVVRLDEAGYEIRWVRGAGVRRGRWKDVEDVVATTVGGSRCVTLRRRDGTTSTIPVDVLAGSTDAFVRDLQHHLNRGHGYRPVR